MPRLPPVPSYSRPFDTIPEDLCYGRFLVQRLNDNRHPYLDHHVPAATYDRIAPGTIMEMLDARGVLHQVR
jgi:hypothetical protein